MTTAFAAPQTARPSINAFMATALIQEDAVAALPKPGLDLFSVPGDVREFARDQTVFVEGDAAVSVYQILSGMIRLCKILPDGRRQIIGFLRAGETIGLSAAEFFGYSAETVTPVTVKRIPRTRIESLGRENPATLRLLLTAMTMELAAAQNQMLLLGRKNAREKLASFLIACLERMAGKARRVVDLPMSRSDIADHLGLTTETVSREITKLKTARLIRLLEGGRVELLDLDALSDLAECA